MTYSLEHIQNPYSWENLKKTNLFRTWCVGEFGWHPHVWLSWDTGHCRLWQSKDRELCSWSQYFTSYTPVYSTMYCLVQTVETHQLWFFLRWWTLTLEQPFYSPRFKMINTLLVDVDTINCIYNCIYILILSIMNKYITLMIVLPWLWWMIVVSKSFQAVIPALLASKGNIVHVSRFQVFITNYKHQVHSVTGLRAFPGVVSYNMSKAALDMLTRNHKICRSSSW